MDISVTIYNYRSFSDSAPARFTIRKGFVAFVGINNSGKSNLLRFLYEFRNLLENARNRERFARSMHDGTQPFDLPGSVGDVEDVFCNSNRRDLRFELEFDYRIAAPEHDTDLPRDCRVFVSILVPRGKTQWAVQQVQARWGSGGDQQLGHDVIDRYWPGVARVLQVLASTLYIGAFRNAINVGAKGNYYDLQIGQAFITFWRDLKSGKMKRKNEAALDIMEQIKKIFGLSGLDINPSPNAEDIQLFVDGKSYLLSEQGSGLSQFIIVLSNVAEGRPALVLIDEPELNLHPALQLDFLTTLASYASFGVLFATHSIGLARSAGQSVFCVQKKDGVSQVQEMGAVTAFSDFVRNLVFGGFPELRFQKILLVEGPTDVVAYQQFLRLYGRDHDFVLLPLGGSSVINRQPDQIIEEIKRIAPERTYAIIDSEITEPDKKLDPQRVNFKAVCEAAKVPCHILEKRATENYIPSRVVKKVLGDKYEPLEQFESWKKTTKLRWAKGDNWRLAREMTKEELEATDLGQFLLKVMK